MQHLLNQFGQQGIPCFFIIDFTKTQSQVYPLEHMPQDILWSMESKPICHQVKVLKALCLKKKLFHLQLIKKHLIKS